MAQAGITYAKDPYDLERFQRLREIAAEIMSAKSGLDMDTVRGLFCSETGFQTPKMDTRAAIFREGKILLVKEKGSGLWSMPGGWVDVMRRFMDAYGKDLEFCQIQLNYLDYKFQHAKEKVELIKQYGLPVWVMEPLRGGKLATVDDKYAAELTALRPDESVPGWGFRFLQSIPEVTMVLSGMSDLQQLAENISIFSEDKPLDSHELTALTGIADKMIGETALPCTGCRYCTAKCPKGLDIPMLIEHYNEHVYSQGGLRAPLWLASIPADKQPSACIGCRSCEQVCPQEIKISEAMKDFVERLKTVKEGAAYGVKPIEDKRA